MLIECRILVQGLWFVCQGMSYTRQDDQVQRQSDQVQSKMKSRHDQLEKGFLAHKNDGN